MPHRGMQSGLHVSREFGASFAIESSPRSGQECKNYSSSSKSKVARRSKCPWSQPATQSAKRRMGSTGRLYNMKHVCARELNLKRSVDRMRVSVKESTSRRKRLHQELSTTNNIFRKNLATESSSVFIFRFFVATSLAGKYMAGNRTSRPEPDALTSRFGFASFPSPIETKSQ